MSYNDVVWLPNALVMTAILGLIAYWRWRHAGTVSGLRWTGVAILPLSLYAIGAFRLVWSVGLSVSHFVSGFVFSPTVWFGLLLAVVAILLIVVPGRVDRRLAGGEQAGSASAGSSSRQSKKALKGSKAPAQDPDVAEIEDILRKHGIG